MKSFYKHDLFDSFYLVNRTQLSNPKIWTNHTFDDSNFPFVFISVFSYHCISFFVYWVLILYQNLTADGCKAKKIIRSEDSRINPFQKGLSVALLCHFFSSKE